MCKTTKIIIYKIVTLAVVLYGCDTRSLTIREEQGAKVFKNKVVGRIFGPKTNEVIGGWRKLHNEEHYNL
jgi:hypothetical protein